MSDTTTTEREHYGAMGLTDRIKSVLATIAPEGQTLTVVTIEAVPAEVGDLESFAGHGLHGIPEDCLHMSDFYEHARSESAQQMGAIR